MHLVLRSSQARGALSFRRPENAREIQRLVARHSRRYGVRIISLANVGNHLHFHLKLGHRRLYTPFIRALTGSIAMAVTGKSRWNPDGSVRRAPLPRASGTAGRSKAPGTNATKPVG